MNCNCSWPSTILQSTKLFLQPKDWLSLSGYFLEIKCLQTTLFSYDTSHNKELLRTSLLFSLQPKQFPIYRNALAVSGNHTIKILRLRMCVKCYIYMKTIQNVS